MPLRLSVEQLRLMSFGPRRDIIALLANDADLSAREIAARLHRNVTSLYRHLDILLEAGLIVQSGSRPGVKRPEALYALAAPTYAPSPAMLSTPEGQTAFSDAVRRYTSSAARDFSRAIRDGTGRPFGRDANVAFYNVDLQLDHAALIAFHKHLRVFLKSVRALRVPGESGSEQVTLTVLVTPA